MCRMERSSWAVGAVLSLPAVAILAGCLGAGSSPTEPVYGGSDTANVNPDGTHKAKPPRVSYRTHDSVVALDILGENSGYANWFWIYRDGELLEKPWFWGRDSNIYHYTYIDSLHRQGTYAYSVRFGYRITELGPKSPAFIYAYPGRSPSGSVSLETDASLTVSIKLTVPPRTGAVRARFERRIGREGPITGLDTVAMPDPESVELRDTGFVPYDTMVYYRAAIMDGSTEEWLAPTAWDSLRVYNRLWEYVPIAELENLGTGVRVEIDNPLRTEAQDGVFYFLYRSRDPARSTGSECDSLPAGSIYLDLRDAPSDTGVWYYWTEARDSHGRISPRSEPSATRITGNPSGPEIRTITVYSSIIQVNFPPYEGAMEYILQRASDTAATPTGVDTLNGSEMGWSLYFADVPPRDGYWYYRVIAVAGTGISEPGHWVRSGYFRRQDPYYALPTRIRNLGSRGVQAELPSFPTRISLLFRSLRADGADSAAVDSVLPTDTTRILRDIPDQGTWYYRAYTYQKPSGQDYAIYRTDWVRVEYTGKAVGPDILRLDKLGTGIDVKFESDPDAIAYIVERSPDTAGTWTVVDTLSVFAGSPLTFSDHPPRNGNWTYRARSLTRDLKATDPGPFLTTAGPWTYRVAYENILVSKIVNRGDRVECPLTTSTSYGYYLKRGTAADYSDPVTVDSALIGDADAKLMDVPTRKVWYYWVERMLSSGTNTGSIYRSVPLRVEFTGAPEVVSLSRVAAGIRIEFPEPDPGDTVEIWRSAGQAGDTASFSLVQRVTSWAGTDVWVDPTPAPREAAFYHYRLILRRSGGDSGFGPAKTFYYDPVFP